MSSNMSLRSNSENSNMLYSHKLGNRNVAEDISIVFLKSMLECIVESWTTISTEESGEDLDDEEYNSETSESEPHSLDETTYASISPYKSEKRSKSDSEWKLVVPKETAIVELKNGCVYEGSLSNLMMDGYGTFRWADGSSYEGNFSKNEIQGLGKMIWPDLNWYEGEFAHGRRQGIGTFSVGFSSISYQGEWLFGQKHGNGCIIYDNEQSYDGQWYKDLYNGRGTRQYGQNICYYGDWYLGRRHGSGCMRWSNNDYYRGDWVDGLMEGYGEYTWDAFSNSELLYPVQNTYSGMWKQGLRDGLGTLSFGFLNGARYEGHFQEGMKHGKGAIMCGNGKVVRKKPLFLNDNPIHMSDLNFYPLPRDDMVAYIPNRKVYAKRDFRGSEWEELEQMHKQKIEYNMSPITEIAIHESSHTIDLTQHLLNVWIKNLIKKDTLARVLTITKILKKRPRTQSSVYGFKTFAPHSTLSLNVPITLGEKQIKALNSILRTPEEISLEEQCTENYITANLPRLWEIYTIYCNVCVTKLTNPRSVMIRLFLWQMYRDCKIINKMSLVETDIILAKNKSAYVETTHYPFEKIYFWQFIHSIIGVAWELYSESIVVNKPYAESLLASVLYKFLQEDLYPNAFKQSNVALQVDAVFAHTIDLRPNVAYLENKDKSFKNDIENLEEHWNKCFTLEGDYLERNILFKYRDIAPIEAMYQYYRSISEPILATELLRLAVPKTGDAEPEMNTEQNYTIYNGRNIVIFDNHIQFIPVNDDLFSWQRSEHKNVEKDCMKKDILEPYFSFNYCLHKIGLMEILKMHVTSLRLPECYVQNDIFGVLRSVNRLSETFLSNILENYPRNTNLFCSMSTR